VEFQNRHDIHGRPPTYICDLSTCLVRYCGDGIVQAVAPLSEECDGTALATGFSSDATCTQRTCKAMTLTFNPAPITYGDPLGDGQLNAVASVQGGTISYNSVTISNYTIGTIPRAGTHKVVATWSPTTDDAQALYDPTSKEGSLVVHPRSANCNAGSYEKMEQDPTPALSFSCQGVLAGDAVGGSVQLERGATPNRVGTYRVVFNQQPSNPNYTITVAEGLLTVKAAAVAGGCGPAAKVYSSNNSAFQGALCATGSASPATPVFPAAGSSTTWSCAGANGGASASCTASREAAAVDGVCGEAARLYLATEIAFDGALCLNGSIDPVSPVFPLEGTISSWTCVGEHGGLDAGCSARKELRRVAAGGGAASGSSSGRSGGSASFDGGGASGASGSSRKLTRDEFCEAVARCPVQMTSCKDPFAPICPKCSTVQNGEQCDSNDTPGITRKTVGGPMKAKAVLDDKKTLDVIDDEWKCTCVCEYGNADHATGCGAQPKANPCETFVASAGGCSINPPPWDCLANDSCNSEIVGGLPNGSGNGQSTNNPRVCCKQLLAVE
jgi:hypothetical protein